MSEKRTTRAAYQGPTCVTALTFGGRTIQIVRPAEPDVLLDDPAILARNAADDYMPYWAYIWPGAYLLAGVIARESRPRGLRALEIGCGLGLAGLVAIAGGLRVEFSDYDPEPLDYVRRSAQASGFDPDSFSTRVLDWRNLPDERFPLIIGADVLYERKLVPLVVGVLETMLEPGGQALLAGPYRVATEDFLPRVAAAGLQCHAEAITAQTEQGASVCGTLHRVWR